MRGRKPKPEVLRRLGGNAGKRKRKPAPEPRAANLPAPWPHLEQNADACAEWNRVVRELNALRLVTVLDLELLAAWCTEWATYLRAERAINRLGEVVKGREKHLVRNPWLIVRNRAIEHLMRLAAEFGFSPASRPRIGAGAEPPPAGAPGDGEESIDGFLARRPGSPAVH